VLLNRECFVFSVFNLGEYRRQATRAYRNHEFFRLDNQEALAIRNKCAQDALEDVIRWIEAGGEVAVGFSVLFQFFYVNYVSIRLVVISWGIVKKI